jgi:hypothetical protein
METIIIKTNVLERALTRTLSLFITLQYYMQLQTMHFKTINFFFNTIVPIVSIIR